VDDPQYLEARVIQAVLFVAVAGSIAVNVFDVAVQWQIPLIFAALYGVFRSVLPIRGVASRLDDAHETLTKLENLPDQLQNTIAAVETKVDGLADQLGEIHLTAHRLGSLADGREITTFSDGDEYYRALTEALNTAKHSLDLTHIRGEVPKDFGDSDHGWFEQVFDWLDGRPNRSVRRIMSVRTNEALDWAHKLCADRERQPSFYVSVIDWPLNIPAVNVAIVDGARVYVALPGPTPQRSSGLLIEDALTVQHYREAYDVMYREAEDLSVWLARTSKT
jgi:hypothetical protein